MCQRLEKSCELLEAVLSLILLVHEGNDAFPEFAATLILTVFTRKCDQMFEASVFAGHRYSLPQQTVERLLSFNGDNWSLTRMRGALLRTVCD